MFVFFLIFNCFVYSTAGVPLNLYNTDHTLDIDNLQVNCLHYYKSYWSRMVPEEKIEYCLGPIDNDYAWNDDFFNIHGRKFTFDELYRLNVTTDALLSWSATIDLAEQYQYYIDHQSNSSLSEQIFFNCTELWFGPRCQFSFDWRRTLSLQDLVRQTLTETYRYPSPYNIPKRTCYTHLRCDRGGSSMCLDWREVCDGRIDCIDGGADEAQCFDLEINQCHEDEYQCHNGLCLPQEFAEDEVKQCFDGSDRPFLVKTPFTTFSILDYEGRLCQRGPNQFVCGNGECVVDFDKCANERHLLLIESISAQGNLSYTCWMIMICLTKVANHVNGTTCDQILISTHINVYLDTCEDLIQFPTVPVLFGHIRFLYSMKEAKYWDKNLLFIPYYICYNPQLCDFLTPTYLYKNYSCREIRKFNFHLNIDFKTYSSFIHLIELYFRKCLTRYNSNIIRNASHYSSLYCCKNSSKCISIHRIVDNISDCYLNDDEEQDELSCSINNIHRFKCFNEHKCYSSSVPQEICTPTHLRTFENIEFSYICDRHVHMFPMLIDGQNHTDETDCEDWICNNYYTRCDGFWSCPNGEDEENCMQSICPSHSIPCITPVNFTFICLSANQVNNGHTDCLGAIDERQYCRNDLYTYSYPSDNGFHCWNSTKCVSSSDLCNAIPTCPYADDEKFCKNQTPFGICWQNTFIDVADVANILCLSLPMYKKQFSLETSSVYPLSESQTIKHIAQKPLQRFNTPTLLTDKLDDSEWLWRCNHGLYVRHWLGGNRFSYKCFCSSSYYGEQCQYQNQRVSLTIQVRIMNFRTIYTIMIRLIDDDDDHQKIISYHQLTSLDNGVCLHNFDTYLTYPSRPKNSSKNYIVRIDAFNRSSNSSSYLGSWHFTISFSFLPVNQMAVVLYIPAQEAVSPNDCPLICQNGKCMKYINKEMYFCQCDHGWSGIRCDIPVRCSDCSSNSTCIGMIHNRSICICPINKYGPRCLLTLPSEDLYCYNNGTLLVLNDGMNKHEDFVCICPKEFFSSRCETPYMKLEISIDNIKTTSVVFIYVFKVLDYLIDFRVQLKVSVQKLTIFQRNLSLYLRESFNMVFVKTNDNYYLAVIQHFVQDNVSTSINSSRRCAWINELMSSEQLAWPPIRQIKQYHKICQSNLNLLCFVDKSYMCLCTLKHHANCFKFNTTSPKCRDDSYCKNGGECLQDELICPTTFMCNCTDCFFGDRCQFYAKGIGLTLDDILRYELRTNYPLSNQSVIIKCSCALTIIIFVAGLLNSILSLLTFSTKKSREIGCGLYLIASSITSLLTISIFAAKFWFLILNQINLSFSYSMLRGGCKSFEFMLKSCLYMGSWFNACVAIERAMTTYKGVNFNKKQSKRIARWVIFILPFIVMITIIHDPLYRDIYRDEEEQRFWCVFHYSQLIQIYDTIISLVHFLTPFCANIFSAFFIILATAHRRAITQTQLTYKQHLLEEFKKHKNLIISPLILVLITIPRLIISVPTQCVKVSHNAWLYLIGYYVSFLPSISIFIIFVLASEFYKEQFKIAIKCKRR